MKINSATHDRNTPRESSSDLLVSGGPPSAAGDLSQEQGEIEQILYKVANLPCYCVTMACTVTVASHTEVLPLRRLRMRQTTEVCGFVNNVEDLV